MSDDARMETLLRQVNDLLRTGSFTKESIDFQIKLYAAQLGAARRVKSRIDGNAPTKTPKEQRDERIRQIATEMVGNMIVAGELDESDDAAVRAATNEACMVAKGAYDAAMEFIS